MRTLMARSKALAVDIIQSWKRGMEQCCLLRGSAPVWSGPVWSGQLWPPHCHIWGGSWAAQPHLQLQPLAAVPGPMCSRALISVPVSPSS